MTYNKIRHLELLKRFLDFENQGKDLYTENRDEYKELSAYRNALYNYSFWKSKEQFISLIDNFIQDSIDMEQFEIAFSKLWWETMKLYHEFEINVQEFKNFDFEPDPKSDGFGNLMSAIFRQFEVLEDEECTEQEVKDYVQNMLQKIQPYL
jgi:hypothetical protein